MSSIPKAEKRLSPKAEIPRPNEIRKPETERSTRQFFSSSGLHLLACAFGVRIFV